VTNYEASDRAHVALEAIVFGAVAVTTRAIASIGPELTFAQWRVVVIVGAEAGGATVTEVAVRLGAEVSPASRLVSRLVRRGLVVARRDPNDRRVKRVTLTDAGHDLRTTVFERRRAMLAEVLRMAGPIGPDLDAALERIATSFGPYI
jgi:DNA-binding MarR family transcriptional regulator